MLGSLSAAIHDATRGIMDILYLWGMKRLVISFVLINLYMQCFADRVDRVFLSGKNHQLGFYMDTYYGFDFNLPEGNRQIFYYNHNRHNSININLALLKFEFTQNQVKGVIKLQTGNYAEDNYAEEPRIYQFINEAYTGLNFKNNWFLDVGIFESHLGAEYVQSNLNKTLSRSLSAENSPYYLSGLRLYFDGMEKRLPYKVLFSVNNGWQRIAKIQANAPPGLGTQFTIKPTAQSEFNWSTFAGTTPDSAQQSFYFNNFYYEINSRNKQWQAMVLYDIGMFKTATWHFWHTPQLLLSYTKEKHQFCLRAEYFGDQKAQIIQQQNPNISNAVQLFVASFNHDIQLNTSVKWRQEIKYHYSTKDMFTKEDIFVPTNLFLITALAIDLY